MTTTEKRVLDAVSAERITDLCRRLVRTPTVSPYSGDRQPAGERAGQDIVEGILRNLGADTRRVPCRDELFEPAHTLAPSGRQIDGRPNIIGTLRLGNGQGPVVVLDAHMDTVAVDTYEGDPFSGDLRDGFIHGRGSSDDKQGITVMLEAARVLAQQGGINGTLVCCSVVDEECDGAGRGSLACLDAVRPLSAAIVIDGSCGAIWEGCTGVITAEVTVSGRAGHAALGGTVNAIDKAVFLMPALAVFQQARNAQPGDFNLGVFQAGNHPANVPNTARLAMNIRTSTADMAAAASLDGKPSGRLVRELLEACIAARAAEDAYLRDNPPRVRWIKDVPAAAAGPRARPFIAAATEAYRDVRGGAPEVALMGGWGDVAHFLNAGIPAFGIGAGYPGAAHNASEKVAVADIEAVARVVALLLLRLFRGDVVL